uniref:RRM domain-containing protein n=1 Tax=Oryza barthii TaxID=65489 RepID=A0A0D3F589_9ORYZ
MQPRSGLLTRVDDISIERCTLFRSRLSTSTISARVRLSIAPSSISSRHRPHATHPRDCKISATPGAPPPVPPTSTSTSKLRPPRLVTQELQLDLDNAKVSANLDRKLRMIFGTLAQFTRQLLLRPKKSFADVPRRCDADDLSELFRSYGTVLSVEVKKHFIFY